MHLVYHVDEGLSGVPREVICQPTLILARDGCLNTGGGFVREGGRTVQAAVGRRTDIGKDG